VSVREIPETEWPRFLEEFSRQHRAWLATVDRCRPGIASGVRMEQRPLESVTPDVAARRVVGIRIQFQQDSHAETAVRVDAPARLRVEETEEGRARSLEIDDERGQCTRIRFRATPPPEALDGIAPGEM
jgi:hypothetical protein